MNNFATSGRRLGALLVIAAAFATAAASPAAAAAPLNNNFLSASNQSGSAWSVAGTTVEATIQPGEPQHAGYPGGHSVWYRWTATATAKVRFDTCTADFGTLLAVYEGTGLATLSHKVSNRWSSLCPSGSVGTSAVILSAIAGHEYRIAVDGAEGATGDFTLRLNAAPYNDDFATAAVVGNGFPGFSNVAATKQLGEPNHAGNPGGHSIWMDWTAPRSGPIRLAACQASFDTLMAVYTGSTVAGLSQVAANDDATCTVGSGSIVSFTAQHNQTYRVAVDGKNGAVGSFQFNYSPDNDHFANPALLGSAPSSTWRLGTLATREAAEPNHAAKNGGGSVWFKWFADQDGPVEINTCGGSFDSQLAVYTGTTLAGLQEVAANDDYSGCEYPAGASAVMFNATMGTEYRIAVDGATPDTFFLNVRPAANDDFAGAAIVAGTLPLTATGSTVATTREPGEPEHTGGGMRTAWWTWTAPADGSATIDTCGTAFDTVLAVYIGSELAQLTPVALGAPGSGCPGGTGRSSVTFPATAGQAYRVAVTGAAYNTAGAVTLHVNGTNAPVTTPPATPDAGTPPPATAPLPPDLVPAPGGPDALRATLSTSARFGVRSLLAGRVRPRVTCTVKCAVSAKLAVSARVARRLGLRRGTRTIATGSAHQSTAGTAAVRLRVPRALHTKLRRLGRTATTLTVRVADPATSARLKLERRVALR